MDEESDRGPQAVDGSLGGFAEQRFELGEGVFNRIEVWRVGRQKPSRAFVRIARWGCFGPSAPWMISRRRREDVRVQGGSIVDPALRGRRTR